ncbi:hypothetical protein, partial [Nodularia sphaerocarpa]|uniref:hypothetical protein n=1 Tax=Nodularia sphaerocarpa TaxID=137816 RepID=UPI00232CB279
MAHQKNTAYQKAILELNIEGDFLKITSPRNVDLIQYRTSPPTPLLSKERGAKFTSPRILDLIQYRTSPPTPLLSKERGAKFT